MHLVKQLRGDCKNCMPESRDNDNTLELDLTMLLPPTLNCYYRRKMFFCFAPIFTCFTAYTPETSNIRPGGQSLKALDGLGKCEGRHSFWTFNYISIGFKAFPTHKEL